jgi:hypothetical protein
MREPGASATPLHCSIGTLPVLVLLQTIDKVAQFMLTCLVLNRCPAPIASSPNAHGLPPLHSCRPVQNTSLYFQSLTYVPPFTNSAIPNVFCILPTFAKKHPGVVWPFSIINLGITLTPTESYCFTNSRSNPFKILLFQIACSANPLQSISFTKGGGGGCQNFPPISRRNNRVTAGALPYPQRPLSCSSFAIAAVFGTPSPAPSLRDCTFEHFLALPLGLRPYRGTVSLKMPSVFFSGDCKRQLTERGVFC